jgi:Ca2+-binding RTX toxin-like protein
VRSGNDLIFKVNESDQVAVAGWFNGDKIHRYVEQIQFANGVQWDLNTIQGISIAAYNGTENNDVIMGWSGVDNINGLGGNDQISTDAGSDVVDGGAGDDSISAGDGNDRVVGGVGNDKINGGNGQDTIFGGAGDDVIQDALGGNVLQGGLGNDVIFGAGTMEGGQGNDVLSAGDFWSADTYIFNLGDGQDTINEYGAPIQYYGVWHSDKLIFGAGINASDVNLVRSGNDLIFKVNESDQVAVAGWFNGDKIHRYVEQIQFKDQQTTMMINLVNAMSAFDASTEPVKLTQFYQPLPVPTILG